VRIIETVVIHLSISSSLGDRSTTTSLRFRNASVTAKLRDPHRTLRL